MFEDVVSSDFLEFSFGGSSYSDQLQSTRKKTGAACGVTCSLKRIGTNVMWMEHNFQFFGGSLGCAEGERLCRGFEYATEHHLPVVIQCRSGGARMQEGTLSLMQMAKVSVAVKKFKSSGLPFITLFLDPTYGGVSASYASQSDIRISIKGARIGFAGPAIILNTVFEMNQAAYDTQCPPQFQSAEFLLDNGQLDMVLEDEGAVPGVLRQILDSLRLDKSIAVPPLQPSKESRPADYRETRKLTRYQPNDIISHAFSNYVALSGDGKSGRDRCITGGLANLAGRPCVVIATRKGHNAQDMHNSNYGMAEPSGYRTAMRLMRLAEQYQIPVVSLVDTCGAYPSFMSEQNGQSEALATNLLVMAELKVPLIAILVGEGGSGGALCIAMGDRVAMLENGYYGVISPEGAASILGRYTSEAHKLTQFPLDCAELATKQHIYATQLQKLGVVDEIIPEEAGEDCQNFPVLKQRLQNYLLQSFDELFALGTEELIARRHVKYRNLGRFDLEESRRVADADSHVVDLTNGSPPASPTTATSPTAKSPRAVRVLRGTAFSPGLPHSVSEATIDAMMNPPASPIADRRPSFQSFTDLAVLQEDEMVPKLLEFVADTTINGAWSTYRNRQPAGMDRLGEIPLVNPPVMTPAPPSAKQILDAEGPEAVVAFMKKHRSNDTPVLITDTTMRDAQQSLIATRVRSTDIVTAAGYTSQALAGAFSLEVWGGATYDVCYRFLHEDPWHRLRALREKVPNVCLQMLIRGCNAVGYTSYADNVVVEFVNLAARNGIDVFRIFDCFNSVESMKVCIDAVKATNKIAEVCMCFTGNFLDPEEKIYTLEYYKALAKEIESTGAHILGLKDMAGLFRPQMAAPFMEAIRSVSDLPIHFHTHNTSSASLASVIEMAKHGVECVDLAISSMADLTSQASLNAFVRSMQFTPRCPQIDPRPLEQLALYWESVRLQYTPFEAPMKAGTARVFDHQIPGGQYSNLIPQSESLGLSHRWGELLDMYCDVNKLFGDIVKVTPSSKVVGDMALFLIQQGLTCADVLTKGKDITFPQSVVEMFKGDLGLPHHGWPVDVQRVILKTEQPLTCRPGLLKPPVNFAEVQQQLQAKYPDTKIEAEDVISSVLYPKVFEEYMQFITNHTDAVTFLPTNAFYYGMKVGQSIGLMVWNTESPVTDLTITLSRIHPIKQPGQRTLTFDVTGKKYNINVKETSASQTGAAALARADPKNPKHVACPLPGIVDKILAKEGETVPAGNKLFCICAMKMEVDVPLANGGTVAKIVVKIGDRVDAGTLLAVLQ